MTSHAAIDFAEGDTLNNTAEPEDVQPRNTVYTTVSAISDKRKIENPPSHPHSPITFTQCSLLLTVLSNSICSSAERAEPRLGVPDADETDPHRDDSVLS